MNLKELWNKQNIVTPDETEIFNKARIFRRRNLLKIIRTNIIVAITSSFVIFIWYYFKPVFISTKIGIILVVLAMIMYLAIYNRIFPLLIKARIDSDSKHFLSQLLEVKRKLNFLDTTILTLYFIILSTGILLYMYEYASRMTTRWEILTYLVVVIFIGINWFYFRPRTIKKQQLKMTSLIEKLQNMISDLSEQE